MLVDDDPIVLQQGKERLLFAGHKVITRESPVGTSATILANRIDVLLIDVLMPGLRGDDVAKLLKRHPATGHVGVVLHSALPMTALGPLVMACGALGAIEKTDNDTLFHFSFRSLVSRLPVYRLQTRTGKISEADPAPEPDSKPSGTYRTQTVVPTLLTGSRSGKAR